MTSCARAFTVLSDKDIQRILQGLSSSELNILIEALGGALVRYSTQNEQNFQPNRAAVTRSTGQVSLFMPATTESLVGVKIVGVAPSSDPSTLPPGTKPQAGLKSALTLCDELGQAIGILNAAELTAFRTAIGSMLLYRSRQNTGNILVFIAGKQALSHIRLAVLLRGKDIQHITIVNRSSRRSQELIETLTSNPRWPSHLVLWALDQPSADELKFQVSASDVIFCTTPSTKPLFPASFLTSDAAKNKTRYIAAIGSYRLDMAEIDPELLRRVVEPSGVFSSQVWQGSIAVDSKEGCLHEAGELVSSGVTSDKWLEVGHIIHTKNNNPSPEMDEWLKTGLVIYKSVGIGVMDLAIGNALLGLAKSMSIGLTVDDF